MSLINKMLQNLEERKDTPESSASPEPVYEDLRPVKLPRVRARRRMGVVLLLLGGAGVGYYAWTQWGDSFFTDSESSTQAPQPPVAVAKPAKPEPVQKQSSASSVPAPQPKIVAAAPKEPTAANTPLTQTVPGPRPAGALRAPNSAVQDVRMPRAQGRAGAAAPDEIVARKKKQAGPPPEPERAAQTETDYHIVVKGDSLYGIAAGTGHSYEELAAWNNIDPPYVIHAGQRLRLSPPGPTSTSAFVAAVAVSPAREGTASAVAQDNGDAQGRASVAGDTTPGMEKVESRLDDSRDGGGRAMQDAIAEQRSRKSGATDVQEAQASRAHGRAGATGVKGSGVLEKKVTPLTVEQKAENDYRRAARYLQQGRPGDAEARLRSALAADPRHAKAREVLVGLSLRNGRWREAKQLLEQGIEEAPRHYPFVQLLARIHVEQGADGQALQLMEGAQQAARSDPEYMAFLATLYQRAGRHADAVKAFKRVIGLRPEAGRWWLGLGISLEAEKNWDEAIKAYTRARYSGSLTPKLVRYVERRMAVIKDK